ncbi:MAG TPA: lysophospholipid acyltransferase family protein [Stellaceae bacterium]|jgi:1-acyl-sn-glycerol-3-phosphate acyltransferase
MGSPALRISRLLIYLAWTLSLMPVQGLGLAWRRPWSRTLPALYHRGCCRILGFRLRTIGVPTAARPVLFASNHISYTDITILGSLIIGSFIAKAEVAGWPLFGWLAKLQRSVFIDRRLGTARLQRDAMTRRLAAGDALILFPEGTSGDGNRVLPFKSALFSAAEPVQATGPIAVQPVSIAYTRLDGMPLGRLLRPFLAWYGTAELAPHLWSMLGLGVVEVVVEFHPPTFLADCGSRKALARYCHTRVAGGMAAALAGRPQPVPPPPSAAAAPALRNAAAAASVEITGLGVPQRGQGM